MFKKIIIVFFSLLVLLFVLAVSLPFLFQEKIHETIKGEINRHINAVVNYEDISVSLIKHFPDLQFSMKNLSVSGVGVFEGDTLIRISEFNIDLDVMSVIKGELYQIHSIQCIEPKLHAYLLSDSTSNWDIFPENEPHVDTNHTESSSSIQLDMNSLTVENGRLAYIDLLSHQEFYIEDIDLSTSLSYASGHSLSIESLLKLGNATVIQDETELLKESSLVYEGNVLYHMDSNRYTFSENLIHINQLGLFFDGSVHMDEDVNVDFQFSTRDGNFEELLSLVPEEYLKDYEEIQANGYFSLAGHVNGSIGASVYPSFDVLLNVSDASMQYADMPSSLDDIQIEAAMYSNTPTGSDLTIDVAKATCSVAGNPISLQLFANRLMEDPFVKMNAQAAMDLEDIMQWYPLEDIETFTGKADLDVSFEGSVSDVEEANYDAIDLEGSLTASEVVYIPLSEENALDASPISVIEVPLLDIDFAPNATTLNQLELIVGKSDFYAKGQLNHLVSYLFGEETLKGTLQVDASLIDLDEWTTSGTTDENQDTQAESSPSTYVQVPDKIDFLLKLQSDNVLYDGISMTNVAGNVRVKNQTVSVESLTANLLGGTATVNGSYSTLNQDVPDVHFSYDIQKFDIQETVDYVDLSEKLAPVSRFLTGNFSSALSLNTTLQEDFSLNMDRLTGTGEIRIPRAELNAFPVYDAIQEKVGLLGLDQPVVEDAWTVLSFENGRVHVDPFQISLDDDIVMDIKGSNGFDQTVDYNVSVTVPSQKFGQASDIANTWLSNANIPLVNASVPSTFTFHLHILGTINKPNVAITQVTVGEGSSVKETIGETLDDIKEEVKDKVDEKIEDIKEETKETVDDAKEEVKEEIDKAKEDLKEEIKDKFKGFGW